MEPVTAGWSAAAWKVQAESSEYFLKVYDKQKPSTKCWVERIDQYIPVVVWLSQNTDLTENMIAPLLTIRGDYKWEDESFLYLVFPNINGKTIGGEELNSKQIRELENTDARLHSYGAELPIPTEGLKETFDVSFCGELNEWLVNSELNELLAPYAETILNFTKELEDTANALRVKKLRFVICHTDIHSRNLMQADKQILIDWEGLKLVPPEADLFSFTETFFFGYEWDELMAEYSIVHPDFQVNSEVMRFYRLRRRLEDTHAFEKSILFDGLTKKDMDQSLWYLKRAERNGYVIEVLTFGESTVRNIRKFPK